MNLNKLNGKLIGTLTIAGLFSSLTLTACNSSFQTKDLETLKSRSGIIGGLDFEEGDILQKNIVAVLDENEGELCTGTLLPNNLVLTAAHCIGEDKDQMFILFGTHLTEDSPRRAIDKIEVSPYWQSRQSLDNDIGDIALVHFTGTLPEGYYPANLFNASYKKLLQKGTPVLLAGYGLTDAKDSDTAGKLKQITVEIEEPVFGTSEILVNQTSGKGACHGDSGGPAFVKIKNKYYLLGVTSRGINDDSDTCTSYSAYSSTLYYRTWITRMSAKLSKSLVLPEFSGIK